MAKKNKSSIVRSKAVQAEIVPRDRGQTEAEFKRMVARLVEKEIAAAMSNGPEEALFQPFLQTREISREMKRRQTVVEQNKYSYCYEDWGCAICGDRERGHKSLSMCQRCFERFHSRLVSSMRKHAPVPSRIEPTFMDSVRLAREALAPSLTVLETDALKDRRDK